MVVFCWALPRFSCCFAALATKRKSGWGICGSSCCVMVIFLCLDLPLLVLANCAMYLFSHRLCFFQDRATEQTRPIPRKKKDGETWRPLSDSTQVCVSARVLDFIGFHWAKCPNSGWAKASKEWGCPLVGPSDKVHLRLWSPAHLWVFSYWGLSPVREPIPCWVVSLANPNRWVECASLLVWK